MPDSSDATSRDVAAAPQPPRRYRWNVGWPPILEVGLIALGVFLGLAGEQWRDRAERRERAQEALRRIRAELSVNRDEVNRITPYHSDAHTRLKAYLSLPAADRERTSFRLEGIQPVQFESTAWQTAQSTQALVDIDTDLAFSLARVYGVQARYQGLTEGITNAMYLRPPSDNIMAFLHSLSLYYADVVMLEPALAKLYDDILPRLER